MPLDSAITRRGAARRVVGTPSTVTEAFHDRGGRLLAGVCRTRAIMPASCSSLPEVFKRRSELAKWEEMRQSIGTAPEIGEREGRVTPDGEL